MSCASPQMPCSGPNSVVSFQPRPRMQQVHGVAQIAGDRALIRDEADALARDGLRIIEQYFQSGLHGHQINPFRRMGLHLSLPRSCSACGIRCRMACRFSIAPLLAAR